MLTNKDIENELLKSIDWVKRDDMFLARLEALEVGMDRQKRFMMLMSIAESVVAITLILTLWPLTPWRIVGTVVAWFNVRFIGRTLVGRWVKREIERIEREHPKPPTISIP